MHMFFASVIRYPGGAGSDFLQDSLYVDQLLGIGLGLGLDAEAKA